MLVKGCWGEYVGEYFKRQTSYSEPVLLEYIRSYTMRYIVYDKYKVLLEILQSKSIKDYKELEETIMSFLLNDDKEILKSVHITMDTKVHQIKELVKKLDVEVSSKKISDYYFENEFENEYKLLLKDKSKKIINALNLVNFTNINTLSSHIYTFNNKEILSLSYYKIKEYYENKANEIKEGTYTSFISNFGKTLERITIEELEYINDCIAIEDTNNAESSTTISLESLEEIRFIRYVILTLKRNQINTSNYIKKQSKYLSLIEEGTLYGIKSSNERFFDNPTELYAQIDFILTSDGFNEKQKTLFYKELKIRERNPKTNDVKDVYEILEERTLCNEVSKYPYEQQDAIFNKTENFEFNEEYYKHIEKYGKAKVDNAVSTVQNNITNNADDIESWFNYTNKTNKKILNSLFTSTSKFRITHLFNLDHNILK